MSLSSLRIHETPVLAGGNIVLAFSGWMDGGDVSTGTVRRLVDQVDATPIAEINPEDFYIYNFPGAMELSTLFRPHVKIVDGLVDQYVPPANTFYCDEERRLAFFVGKEPNLNWHKFSDCVFSLAKQVQVSTILFVGSFGGTVPHTREPRLYVTASNADLRARIQEYGLRPTDYEGPGSFAMHLMAQAADHGFEMASLVAEIPGYLQGENPRGIEAVTHRLSLILGLTIDLAALRGASNQWENEVSTEIEKNDELLEKIRELEERYDDELIDSRSAGEED